MPIIWGQTTHAARYLALADFLARQIQTGVYRIGARLPSVRALQKQTGLGANTVVSGFLELERRGLIEARPRSGYFVRLPSRRPAPAPAARRAAKPRVPTLHSLTQSVVEATARRDLVPLGGAVVAAELMPLKALARGFREILRHDPGIIGRYGAPNGLPGLRAQIARRMVWGAQGVTADDVVVTQGCMHALRLALMATTSPGDVVAVEQPTFFGYLQAIRDLGLKALEVRVDPALGLDLEALQHALKRAAIKAVLVTPDFQNPLGCVMPDAHKQRLVRMASDRGFVVIESDVYGELAHSGRRPLPAVAFDQSGSVIYCSSFSKTLAAGLRVGWILPGRHAERVRSLSLSGGITQPPLNQTVIEGFLADGGYDRHLVRLRAALNRQMQVMTAAISERWPSDIRLSRPQGGFLLWAECQPHLKSDEFYERALAQGVAVLPGAVCSLGNTFRHCLRLNCGYPWSPRLERGIAFLGRCLGES